jgi:predicted acyltransferase
MRHRDGVRADEGRRLSARAAPLERLAVIDQYRGLAIVLMVLANYLADVTTIPGWLKHAPDIGLSAIDLIAPLFIFAIGLTYGLSWSRRRQRDGTPRTIGHFLRRNLALVGIGAIISAGEAMIGMGTGAIPWGVLQAIGVAGMVAIFALFIPPVWRIAVGLVVLGCYQALLDAFWLSTVLHSGHGGIQGAVSWSAMLVLATGIADLWHGRGRSAAFMALSGCIALALGIGLSFLFAVSKNRVSASYVLISLGASALLFAAMQSLAGRLRVRPGFLSWWGANPLLLYMLHYLLLALFVLPGIPWWHAQAPLALVFGQCVVLIAALGLIARLLARRGITVSL